MHLCQSEKECGKALRVRHVRSKDKIFSGFSRPRTGGQSGLFTSPDLDLLDRNQEALGCSCNQYSAFHLCIYEKRKNSVSVINDGVISILTGNKHSLLQEWLDTVTQKALPSPEMGRAWEYAPQS